jgi:hypothetical protein
MMAGHTISLEGRELVYFAAGEDLPENGHCAIGYDPAADEAFRDHERVRRVLGTLIHPTPKVFQALHWSDGRDLRLLDSAVKSGAYDESDFDGALLTEAHMVVCLSCSAATRVLLVDAGQVLFHRTLPERLRSHALVAACPQCQVPWTLRAVEVIDAGA